jgi:hypothetical protein
MYKKTYARDKIRSRFSRIGDHKRYYEKTILFILGIWSHRVLLPACPTVEALTKARYYYGYGYYHPGE